MNKGKYEKLFAIIKYPIMLIAILVMSISIAGSLFANSINTVTISYNGMLVEVTTSGQSVGDALQIAGIELTDEDKINYNIETSLARVDLIEIESPISLTVNVEGKEMVLKSFQSTVGELLEENDIDLSARDIVVGADLDDQVRDGMKLSLVRISDEYDTQNITIEYDVQYVPDYNMLEGQSKVMTQGRNGTRTKVYRVLKEDGQEISRTMLSDKITQNPIKEVIAYGTIANFINSRGQSVSYNKSYIMTATAYTACDKWGYAVHMPGKSARVGVIAVDPKVIPLGTKVYVEGMYGIWDYGFAIAWDTGGSIKGNKIDLFMNTEAECYTWGIKTVKLYVLHDQSIDIFALRG